MTAPTATAPCLRCGRVTLVTGGSLTNLLVTDRGAIRGQFVCGRCVTKAVLADEPADDVMNEPAP